MKTRIRNRAMILIAAMVIITAASTYIRADTGTCEGASVTLPFTDVPSGNVFFCSIAEAYFSALTNGTTATTYSPSANVPREQMAAFITRTLDQSLSRGSRRSALDQFWVPTSTDGLAYTTVGSNPFLVKSDGADLWVANFGSNTVSRVRASDGKLLETWLNASSAAGVLVAKGLIFITGQLSTGKLYQIDPTQPPGSVTLLSGSLGGLPTGIAFDGARVWTANQFPGSVSIVTLNPLSVTTVTTGFSSPVGILYDGSNIWVTDHDAGQLKKLDASGNVLQSVDVGIHPNFPVFDGTNIWVPNFLSDTVTVVRAATGTVLATLSGNGLNEPLAAAFDGQRILVTNNGVASVSLWKAADLSPLGTVSTGSLPFTACSDGLNFWITLTVSNKLARF